MSVFRLKRYTSFCVLLSSLVSLGIAHTALAQPDISQLAGSLVVLNKQGHDASFIDLASGDLVATLPTGRGPHELIATSDGRWAIGTDYSGGNSLTVFELPNPVVRRTIDLSAAPGLTESSFCLARPK